MARRTAPADERADSRTDRPDLPVGRRPPFGEDDEHPPVPEELDQSAGSRRPLGRRGCSRSRRGHQPRPPRARPGAREGRRRPRAAPRRARLGSRSPCGVRPRPERLQRLFGHELLERELGACGEHLAEPGHARAADREDVDEGKPAADSDRVEEPSRARRQVRREAREEPRQEHVVARGEVETVRAVAATAHSEVQRRAEDGHVGLAAGASPRRASRAPARTSLALSVVHAKRCARVRPHAVADRVVEIRHVYILAPWRRSSSETPLPSSRCPGRMAARTASRTTWDGRSPSSSRAVTART